MTQTARISLSALPRGHEFPPSAFSLSAAEVRAYLDAIGDRHDYGAAIPPLCALALALARVQEEVALPDGSLHTGQEVESDGALKLGEALTLTGRVAQRSERQGFVISVLELEVRGASGGRTAARTTIMAPGSGA